MRFKQNLSQEEVALLLCESVKGWQRQKGIYNLQHISYYSRLKRFMRGFNGVSTKYLNSYLAWNKPCKLRQRKRNGEEEHFPDFRFDSIENWRMLYRILSRIQ